MTSRVDIWWMDLARFSVRMVDGLDSVERARRSALIRDTDRRRFTLGAVLLRRAAAGRLGIGPEDVVIDRVCRRCGAQHGKPSLSGSGLYASVTHSGELVGVGLTSTAPIGLDVEHDGLRTSTANLNGVSRLVLSAAETCPRNRIEFLRYWTRKESVIKATGDGFTVDPAMVVVSGPHEPPQLISYCGHPREASMVDLAPRPDYPAALTLLTNGDVKVVEHLPA